MSTIMLILTNTFFIIKQLYINCKNLYPNELQFIFEQDENGDYIYEIGVEAGQIYSSLTTEKNKILNPEIVENLDNVAKCLGLKDSLAIRIYSPKEHIADAENIKSALNNHYSRQIAKVNWEIGRYMRQAFFTLLAGILFFSMYVLLKTYFNSNWWEIIDIVSWVFLWETVDLSFIARNTKRLEQVSYKKIINAKISIIPTEKKTKIKPQGV